MNSFAIRNTEMIERGQTGIKRMIASSLSDIGIFGNGSQYCLHSGINETVCIPALTGKTSLTKPI